MIGGVIAAAAVSSFYDDRSLGERVDAATAAATASASSATQQVGESVRDASITAAVKTARGARAGFNHVELTLGGPGVRREAGTARVLLS